MVNQIFHFFFCLSQRNTFSIFDKSASSVKLHCFAVIKSPMFNLNNKSFVFFGAFDVTLRVLAHFYFLTFFIVTTLYTITSQMSILFKNFLIFFKKNTENISVLGMCVLCKLVFNAFNGFFCRVSVPFWSVWQFFNIKQIPIFKRIVICCISLFCINANNEISVKHISCIV